MQSDRELLELAAKAAGLVTYGDYDDNMWAHPADQHPDTACRWNPLTDDGDALRLAVKLRLDIAFVGAALVEVCWFDQSAFTTRFAEESINDAQGEREATRRAIVRAAAEIAVRAHPDHKDGGANE